MMRERERELYQSLHPVKTEVSKAREKIEEMASRIEMVMLINRR